MKPLDEAAWQAWLARNLAQEIRSSATFVKTMKWVSVVILVAAVLFGPYLGSFGVPVRFVLTLGTLVVMWDAVKLRDYTFAIAFGALALLYNPILPLVNFTGFLQCALMILSAILFILSLTWHRVQLTHDDYRSDVGIYPRAKRPDIIPINADIEKAEDRLPAGG